MHADNASDVNTNLFVSPALSVEAMSNGSRLQSITDTSTREAERGGSLHLEMIIQA